MEGIPFQMYVKKSIVFTMRMPAIIKALSIKVAFKANGKHFRLILELEKQDQAIVS